MPEPFLTYFNRFLSTNFRLSVEAQFGFPFGTLIRPHAEGKIEIVVFSEVELLNVGHLLLLFPSIDFTNISTCLGVVGILVQGVSFLLVRDMLFG